MTRFVIDFDHFYKQLFKLKPLISHTNKRKLKRILLYTWRKETDYA